MCGILVVPNQDIKEELELSFKALYRRGPDMERVLNTNHYSFMFHRLSIMGLNELGMQPFTKFNDVLVANAEIYNYEDLKQKVDHLFVSESDCEVLLPLYHKYGIEMFNMLDAEFILVLYDSKLNKLIAARDPIGIRPLFYGYNKDGEILFASEAKGLIHLVEKVYPFPPGHYYMDGNFIPYTTLYNIKHVEKNMDVILDEIYNRLNQGIIKRLHADAPLGFLLSGGLDSSLVCALASKHLQKPIQTFSIGMDVDAIDLKYARDVANHIGSIHHEVIMTRQDVLDALETVIFALETYDITTIRASIGMFLVAKYVHEKTDIKVLLTGEVSDELFGYKYTDFAPNAKSFQDESVKRLKELFYYDVLRADRTLAFNSLEARVPFADLSFANFVLSIDPELKMNKYGMGKYLLRKAFDNDDLLPHHILWREKAAFSDAVGHSMVDDLKAYAETLYTDDEFKLKSKSYKVNPPISKESLLYREIFEKYYQDHSHLIPGFWMPNQTWKGLEDVNDPSARILTNYGNSGK